MARTLWVKKGKGLWPGGPHSEELLQGIPDGAFVYTSEPKHARNPQFHRLIMKVLSLVIEHTWPQFKDINALMDHLKLKSGMVDYLEIKPGMCKVRFKSIAFDKMDEAEFHRVYEQWSAIISAELIPGVDPMALLEEARRAA